MSKLIVISFIFQESELYTLVITKPFSGMTHAMRAGESPSGILKIITCLKDPWDLSSFPEIGNNIWLLKTREIKLYSILLLE